MLRDAEVPTVKLFPDIVNRDAFINNKHPRYNPKIDKDKYVQYWDEETRRCIEGWWVKEKDNHWRWMYPDLYFYINHWTIKHKPKGSNSEIPIKPYLRDTEWIILSAWTACMGFSGFTEDNKYSCNHLLKKYYQQKEGEKDKFGFDVELSEIDIEELESNKWVFNDKGQYKEYIEPLDLLKKHHDSPKGLALYQNPRKDLFLFGSRGTGKSFICSSVIGREFTFDGRVYYKTDIFEHGNEIGSVFAGAEPSDKIDSLYEKVFFGLDSFEGGYEDTTDRYPPPFYKIRKGSMPTGGSGAMKHEYRVQYPGGNWNTKGKGSFMQKGIYRNNPDAAVGERKNIIITEEVGLAQEILTIHANNQNVLIRNGEKIGSNFYLGTGGNIEKIDGAKKLFNNPVENGILTFKNHWDKGQNIGLFIPVEYTLGRFKDPNGNTRLNLARKHQADKRRRLAQGKDTTAFTRNRMFEPIHPADMFLSSGKIIFDQGKASLRLSELDGVDDWRKNATFGELKSFSNEPGDVVPQFKPFIEAAPIIGREIDEAAGKRGSIIFHRHPPKGVNFRMKGSRFRITYDPVKIDKEGPSFASILVLDTKHYDIASEYLGRRDSPEDIHKICLDLCLYYNAPVLAELNVTGFKGHAKRRGMSHYLYPTPMYAISKTTQNPKERFGEVGVVLTGQIKKGAILQATGLMNKLDEAGMTMYEKVQSTRLLEEMEVWDGIENSDHISSFLLQALWEEEESHIDKGMTENLKKQYEDLSKTLGSKNINIQREILTSWQRS